MWAEAAKQIRTFDNAVLTMLDVDGYPLSVRVDTSSYDATSGELNFSVPQELRPAEGPARLLCHFHDEKLWSLSFTHVGGSAKNQRSGWVFVSTTFSPPPRLGVLGFVRSLSTSAQKYLDKRGLGRPRVDWAALKQIQRRAKA